MRGVNNRAGRLNFRIQFVEQPYARQLKLCVIDILKRLSLTLPEKKELKAIGEHPTVLRVKLDERRRLRLAFASSPPFIAWWCQTMEQAMTTKYFDFGIADAEGRISSLDMLVDDRFMKHELGNCVNNLLPVSGSGLFASARTWLNMCNTPMGRMLSLYSSNSEYGQSGRLQFSAPWAFYHVGKERMWMDIAVELPVEELPQSSQFRISRSGVGDKDGTQ